MIEERGFEALTVGELTECALVSRAAFYRNYEDKYDRLYRALLGSKGSPWFVRKMRARLSDLIKERGRQPHGPHESSLPVHTFSDEFVPDLVSALFVEAITWWLEQGRPYTPREIATRTARLSSALFKEASTWP